MPRFEGSETDDPYNAWILNNVCDLYAPTMIEENRAWDMGHERFDGTRSKTVTRAVDDLCMRLLGKALELVEGRGVEESWLNSTMLRSS